jgi:superfamily II DNA or RNA helicase
MDELIRRYNKYIYDRTNDLINSGKEIEDFDNFDLAKIFEYYSCIKLSQESRQIFYEYDDINPEFKELNNMTKNDTGIDACNLVDTIVQCKLRKDNLNWKECSTFFGSNVITDDNGDLKIKWKKMIITRNKECTLSDNLKHKQKQFIDKTYSRKEILDYCSNLLDNPPKVKREIQEKVNIRDYQKECIDMIKDSKENIMICLPTGTGKNFIIVHALNEKDKYLILVPRIILMEQIMNEIIKCKPKFKNSIQMIGDGNTVYDEEKNITICVYNSVNIIEKHIEDFDKIFVDEAHHIIKPEIYKTEEELDIDSDNDSEDDSEESDSEDDSNEDSEESNSEDDEDNESSDNKNYIDIIKSFRSNNNNIYLSATIDKNDKFKYYSKDIRDMIDKKYLCDYTINIPIFSDDPTNKNICKYLIDKYRNVIIYCNSQKEGMKINKLMNSILKNSSEYIDCNTLKSKRNKILDKYKSGDIPFLVNVKILVEGFDAPITKGVCFMHLPSSKTTLIQIIGRALRLHQDKVMANIILPFSDNKDEDSINNFLKVMAKNDSRIRKSYMNKTVGGYIDLVYGEELDDEDKENLIELKYELIFDKMGMMTNNVEIWEKRLEEVKKFIDENDKIPSQHDKVIKIKQLGWWIGTQKNNYVKKQCIMSNEVIRKKWNEFIEDDKYKKYFLSNEEEWFNNLEKVKLYINKNNKRPSSIDKDIKIQQIGYWIGHQLENYAKKQHIMSNEDIQKRWKEFIEDDKYKEYFISNEEEWENKLKELKSYINLNKKRPNKEDKDIKVKQLGRWLSTQQYNYAKKQRIMSNKDIQKRWKEFIEDDKYKEYFLSNKEEWGNKLKEVKSYIDTNKKRPSNNDKTNTIKQLANWIGMQQKKFAKKDHIMSNDDIRKKWEEFIEDDKYSKYFISNEEEWENKLKELKLYIDMNHKRPSTHNKDNKIKQLGIWLGTQQYNYAKKQHIMSNEYIQKRWKEFIEDDKYKEYFMSNDEIWENKLEEVKLYIDDNGKRPSSENKDIMIKQLGIWILNQQNNYGKKQRIMLNEDILKKWKQFIEDKKYNKYFLSNEEEWENKLEEFKSYIDMNNKRPSSSDKDIKIKQLGYWIGTQQNNYKKEKEIMKDENIRKQWKEFIEDKKYSKYFNTTKINNESSSESEDSDSEEEIEEPVKKNVKKLVPKAPTKKVKK